MSAGFHGLKAWRHTEPPRLGELVKRDAAEYAKIPERFLIAAA